MLFCFIKTPYCPSPMGMQHLFNKETTHDYPYYYKRMVKNPGKSNQLALLSPTIVEALPMSFPSSLFLHCFFFLVLHCKTILHCNYFQNKFWIIRLAWAHNFLNFQIEGFHVKKKEKEKEKKRECSTRTTANKDRNYIENCSSPSPSLRL